MKHTAHFSIAAVLLLSSAALAQIEIQVRLGQQPRDEIPDRAKAAGKVRVWVDRLAELRLRGGRLQPRHLR